MYQSKPGLAAAAQGHSNSWVNWKMALTYFALLNTPFPGQNELAALRVKLTDAGKDQCVTKKEFCSVDFWFDAHEGKPDAALLAKWAAEKAARQEESEFESSEEEGDAGDGRPKQLDKERLQQLKQLLFDIYRVPTGEDKVVVPDFVDALIEQRDESSSAQKYGEYLFGN